MFGVNHFKIGYDNAKSGGFVYKVIIADDSVKTLAKLSQILHSFVEIADVYEASNGWEALELFKKKPVDLVIIDIVMPIMDGLQALKELKILDPGVLIIVISSLNQKELLYQAIESGADQYIIKPLESDVIRASLENLLGRELTLNSSAISHG
jgi:two-component system, chemotaxis family, chemotaxis protein CheY